MKRQEFLNPKSMITPGIAGGIVMLITNSLISHFDLSGPTVALALSFLVGALVFLAKTIPLWQRMIYYALNSLIIFSMATGTAFVGHKAQGNEAVPTVVAPVPVATNNTNPVAPRSPTLTTDIITNSSAVHYDTGLPMMKPQNGREFFRKW